MLASAVASFSAHPKNPTSSRAMEDPKISVETSLRKALPSKSNLMPSICNFITILFTDPRKPT
ncbi:hypothetical protein C1H46_012158 [Malus baccata]|uniref:Uncharacterized protein n=1 Tax=Malus baccata TaxID=106549 RepID=A0A540MTM8_MALBA|nr:hypothetical protein C1H46_012158 [Malus baccata]